MDGDAYLREAKILFASGQPEQSIRYFSLALEHGSDPLIVGLSRGTAWMAQGMHREAEQDFTMALEDDPGNERAHYFRGVARFALGEYANAVADLTRSLTQNHVRGIAYLARGLAYAELGEQKDAALDLSTASSFSSAEVDSFLKLFGNDKSRRNRTMSMLRRESAPWKSLLTKEEAEKIRSWF